MKKSLTTLLASLCFLFYTSGSQAQQEPTMKYVGLDWGMDFQVTEIPDYQFIRGLITLNEWDDQYASVSSTYFRHRVSAKMEGISADEHWGYVFGIRYSQLHSALESSATTRAAGVPFFYLRIREDGTTTEYLKIHRLVQNSSYFGVPIELKWMPFNKLLKPMYFKAGMEASYRLSTVNRVEFSNQDMHEFKDDVLQLFDDPDEWYLNYFIAMGVRVGPADKIHLDAEAFLFSGLFTQHTSSLVETLGGSGFQMTLQVPIQNAKP